MKTAEETRIDQLASAIWNSLPYDQQSGTICTIGEVTCALRNALKTTGLAVVYGPKPVEREVKNFKEIR